MSEMGYTCGVVNSFGKAGALPIVSAQGRSYYSFTNLETTRMAKKLYVGGLPYSTNDNELRDAFAAHGAVESANVIIDKMTGRSRGFGFVTMPNDEEAMKAIDTMNGADLGGRTIMVNEARPLEDRPPRRDNGGFRGGSDRGGRY